MSTIPTRLQPQHAYIIIYNYIYNIYPAGLHMPGLHFISTFLDGMAVTVPYTVLHPSNHSHIPYTVQCAALPWSHYLAQKVDNYIIIYIFSKMQVYASLPMFLSKISISGQLVQICTGCRHATNLWQVL